MGFLGRDYPWKQLQIKPQWTRQGKHSDNPSGDTPRRKNHKPTRCSLKGLPLGNLQETHQVTLPAEASREPIQGTTPGDHRGPLYGCPSCSQSGAPAGQHHGCHLRDVLLCDFHLRRDHLRSGQLRSAIVNCHMPCVGLRDGHLRCAHPHGGHVRWSPARWTRAHFSPPR